MPPRSRKLPVVPEHVVKDLLKDVPKRYKAKARRALTGTSRVDSMEWHCVWCCGYDYQAVKECQVRWCPLWRFRPGSIDA